MNESEDIKDRTQRMKKNYQEINKTKKEEIKVVYEVEKRNVNIYLGHKIIVSIWGVLEIKKDYEGDLKYLQLFAENGQNSCIWGLTEYQKHFKKA